MLVARLFTVLGVFIGAIPISSIRWTRQQNKEFKFNIEFSKYPGDDFYYLKIIDQDNSLKYIASGYASKSSSDTEYTMNSWENALDAEGWIPDNWSWWDNKSLSFVISDHCYGFRKISISDVDKLSSCVDYENVNISEIDNGNGSVYLDTHGYFIEESETEIAYYENGFIIYRIDVPEEARRPGMVLRWSDSVGGTTDISVQFKWSDDPYDYEVGFSEEQSPARSDSINPNETEGIDIPEGTLDHLFIKFNLKYDSGESGENYENEITTVDGVVYYGKTPILSAFEVIYRVNTKVSPGIIDVESINMTADIHDKKSLLESIKSISDAFNLIFFCDVDNFGVVTLNCYSLYGDNIKSEIGSLSDIKNINVYDKSEELEVIDGLHCFGSGDGIDRLHVFIKADGVENPVNIKLFEDGDINDIVDLENAGYAYMNEQNSISSKVTFEYYGSKKISINDYISIINNGKQYENNISEERIECDENGASSRFFTIGTKQYPLKRVYGNTFSGKYLNNPKAPSSVSAKDIDGSWYLSWIGNGDLYLIEYKKSSSDIWNRISVSTNYCLIGNINPGTEYLFRIYSVINGVISSPSTTVSTSYNNDDQLIPSEKSQYRVEWEDLVLKIDGIESSSNLYGLTSEKTLLDNAFLDLANYINGGDEWISGIPLWISDSEINKTTTISFITWKSLWNSVYSLYDNIVNEIRELSSVSLNITSRSAIRKRNDSIDPYSITAIATKVNGDSYSGRYIISVSYDGSSFIDLYTSSSDEASKSFDIPSKVEIEGVEHYIISIRFRLYKSGGTSIKLSQEICSISQSIDTSPVYWGPRDSAPYTEPFVENDYYFDSNDVLSGGGVIRYFNGSIWVEATSLWSFYSNAVSSAITDMMIWVSSTGETIAAANAVFESIVASEAFISKLSTSIQYSALMCDDGITPRMEIDWDNAICTFRSQSGDDETIITENEIISYSGKGIFRRGLRIKNDSVSWIDHPESDSITEIARMRRLNVGSDKIFLDGDFNSNSLDPQWSEPIMVAEWDTYKYDFPCYIQLSNGEIRIAYAYRGGDYKLVEKIYSNGEWGTESLINSSGSGRPKYIQTYDGTLRISYIRFSDNSLVERIYSEGSWGAELIISSNARLSGQSYIQLSNGRIFISYSRGSDNYLVEREFIDGSWGSESLINESASRYPEYIQLENGEIRIVYIEDSPDNYLMERIKDGESWGSQYAINEFSSNVPNLIQGINGILLISYGKYDAAHLKFDIYERVYENGEWGSEVLIKEHSNNPNYIALSDGSLRMSYTSNFDDIEEIRKNLYQSLSYPQSGFVSGRGWWIDFADGTRIQYSISLNFAANTPTYVPMPLPFYDSNVQCDAGVLASVTWSGFIYGVALRPDGTYSYWHFYSTQPCGGRLKAIGRWKE